MIDTHAHLYDERFSQDLLEVAQRARAAGVVHCIIPGELPRNSEEIRRICALTDGWALPCLGLYPGSFGDEDIDEFDAYASQDWIAFGEVGIDTWSIKDEAGQAYAEKGFNHVLSVAKRMDRPVNVHARNCGKRAIELLMASGCKRVQLHAFEAKYMTIQAGIDAGFSFSIPPNIVRSGQKVKMARQVPISQLLLETDSPYLGPDGSSRNEPANVAIALEAIAKIKELSIRETERILDENTKRLYF